jgi:hypothetical protein
MPVKEERDRLVPHLCGFSASVPKHRDVIYLAAHWCISERYTWVIGYCLN